MTTFPVFSLSWTQHLDPREAEAAAFALEKTLRFGEAAGQGEAFSCRLIHHAGHETILVVYGQPSGSLHWKTIDLETAFHLWDAFAERAGRD